MRILYVLPVDPDKDTNIKIEQSVLNDIDKVLVSPSQKIQKLVSGIPYETDYRLSDNTYSFTGSDEINIIPMSQRDLFHIHNIYDLLQEISCINSFCYLLIIHKELLPFVLSYFNNSYETVSDVYCFSLGEDLLSKEERTKLERRKDYTEQIMKEIGFIPFDANALLHDTSVLLSQSDILFLRKGRYFQKDHVYASINGMIKENNTGITIETADNIICLIHHQTNAEFVSVSCDLSEEDFKKEFLKIYGSL